VRGRRSAYIVVFLVAALGAGVLAYLAQPRTEIVRARSNIAVLTPITADMLEVVRVSPGDAATQTARSIDAVVGRYAATPVLAGQDVDLRTLEDNPGQRAFGFGAPLGPGDVAFALPVDASQAVGGALAAGARVDVVAVPNSLKTQSGGTGGTAPAATFSSKCCRSSAGVRLRASLRDAQQRSHSQLFHLPLIQHIDTQSELFRNLLCLG
jgi:Flp pilus assembly protein CpaB